MSRTPLPHDHASLARYRDCSGTVAAAIALLPIFPFQPVGVCTGRILESEAEREDTHGDVEAQRQARDGRRPRRLRQLLPHCLQHVSDQRQEDGATCQ